MPHVNDKHAIAFVVTALGAPAHRHTTEIVNGRRAVDTISEGQRDFQALLFRLLTGAFDTHSWDKSSGRKFRDLPCYFSWVLPLRDTLVIRTSTAARVASFIVPYIGRGPSGEDEIAGIAGLRIETAAYGSIVLRHPPTGGSLVLEDTSSLMRKRKQAIRQDLDFEVQCARKIDLERGRVPVFEASQLSRAEELACVAERPGSPLLAALMARINLWWHAFRARLTTLPPARGSASIGSIRWEAGFTAAQLGSILVASPLAIPGVRFVPAVAEGEPSRLSLGSEYVDLYGPGQRTLSASTSSHPDLDAVWRQKVVHLQEQLG